MDDASTGPVAVRTVRIIWFALLLSILLYAGLIVMVVPKSAPGPLESAFSNPIILVLHAMGVAVFFMAFVMSSLSLRRTLSAGHPHTPAPPLRPGMVTAPARVRLALIIRWAMLESSAIFGLLAAYIARDPRLFLPLGGLAVVGMLTSYPSDERLRDMAASPL